LSTSSPPICPPPEIAMILIRGFTRRILTIVSAPSCSGMKKSVMTISGCSLRNRSIPRPPSSAVRTSCPPRWRIRDMVRRTPSSSSMTRIFTARPFHALELHARRVGSLYPAARQQAVKGLPFGQLTRMCLPSARRLVLPSATRRCDRLGAGGATDCDRVCHVGGVLGYGAYAGKKDEVHAAWRASMAELATCPNVSVKLGGMLNRGAALNFRELPAPPNSAAWAAVWRPYVEPCIELFGAERCNFESNFPVDKMGTGYVTLWNAFKRITAGFSPTEKLALHSGTAKRLYRLD